MSAADELRELWTAQGVPAARQEELIAAITAKAQPGAMVGPFRIPFAEELTPAGPQYVIPGCERAEAAPVASRQLSLFA
jgi:hypothetical protein